MELAGTDFWLHLSHLQQNGILCDLQFNINSEVSDPLNTIHLHKLVVAGSSSFFLSSLKSSGSLRDVYDFDGISRENLMTVIDYIYRRITWKQVTSNQEALAALQTLQVIQHQEAIITDSGDSTASNHCSQEQKNTNSHSADTGTESENLDSSNLKQVPDNSSSDISLTGTRSDWLKSGCSKSKSQKRIIEQTDTASSTSNAVVKSSSNVCKKYESGLATNAKLGKNGNSMEASQISNQVMNPVRDAGQVKQIRRSAHKNAKDQRKRNLLENKPIAKSSVDDKSISEQDVGVRRSSRTPKPSRLLLEMDRKVEKTVKADRTAPKVPSVLPEANSDVRSEPARSKLVQKMQDEGASQNSHHMPHVNHSQLSPAGLLACPGRSKRYKVDVKNEYLNTIVTVLPEDASDDEGDAGNVDYHQDLQNERKDVSQKSPCGRESLAKKGAAVVKNGLQHSDHLEENPRKSETITPKSTLLAHSGYEIEPNTDAASDSELDLNLKMEEEEDGMDISAGTIDVLNVIKKDTVEATGPPSNVVYDLKDAIESRVDPKTQKTIYKCSRCFKTCLTQQAIITHQRRVHNMAHIFTCQTCSQTFTSQAGLANHRIKVHNQHPFQCTTCGQMFKSQMGLKTHIGRLHERVEPQQACSKCDKKFHLRQELKVHEATHSDSRPFVCSLCPRSFKTKPILRRHEKTYHSSERKFMCDICGMLFKTKNDLHCHVVRHKDGTNPVVVRQPCRFPDNQEYKCRFCPKHFKKRSHQKAHENLQHRQKSSGTSFLCTLCNRSFAIRHYLMQHIKNRHLPRRHLCPHCDAAFVYGSELRKHSTIPGRCPGHPPVAKPFTCPKCHRGFSLKGNLMKHLTKNGRCKGAYNDVILLIQQEAEGDATATTAAVATQAVGDVESNSSYIIINEDGGHSEALTAEAAYTLMQDAHLTTVPYTDLNLTEAKSEEGSKNTAAMGPHIVLQGVDGDLTEVSEVHVGDLGSLAVSPAGKTIQIPEGIQCIAVEGQDGVQQVILTGTQGHSDIQISANNADSEQSAIRQSNGEVLQTISSTLFDVPSVIRDNTAVLAVSDIPSSNNDEKELTNAMQTLRTGACTSSVQARSVITRNDLQPATLDDSRVDVVSSLSATTISETRTLTAGSVEMIGIAESTDASIEVHSAQQSKISFSQPPQIPIEIDNPKEAVVHWRYALVE